MTRVAALAVYLIVDLHTSLLAVAPPALAAALFWVTFYYPVSPDYLAAVGGWDLAVVCLVVTLLLSDRANRARMYPLVARLPRRLDLLAAVILAVLAVMVVIAAGFAGLVLVTGRVTLTVAEGVLIGIRWAAVFLLASAVGLHLSRLVSRGGSHVATALILAAVITAGSWRSLAGGVTAALADALQALASPAGALLGGRAGGLDGPALAAVLGTALVLLVLAALLLRRKDLLWPE